MSHFSRFANFTWTGRDYRLGYALSWEVGRKGSQWLLVIPEGIHFDLSVPRGLHWLQNPHDQELLPAAAVHDELLRKGFDRPFAAAEFRRASRARGVGPWKAWTLFFAVLAWTSRSSGLQAWR